MPKFNYTAFVDNYDSTSFLNRDSGRFLLVAHIVLMLISFVGLFPVSLMLSIAKSPLHTPLHIVFLAVVALGMIPIIIYSSQTTNLYPSSLHSWFGWVVLFLLVLHFAADQFQTLLGWVLSKPPPAGGSGSVHVSPSSSHHLDDSVFASDYGFRYHPAPDGGREYVLETGHADDLERLRQPHHPLTLEYRIQRTIATRCQPIRRALARLPERLLTSLLLLSSVVFSLLNRPMIFIAYFQILSGIVTATGMGQADKVYGLLAHFIKGSVFLWFGVLTFGRVLGAFANLGWAWNVRPPLPYSKLSFGARFFRCNIEMIESGLIFFYGITNIFMEHLGNKDGKWSHKDLQHVSIAFLYIGGGLCGLLYESSTIRSLFNAPLESGLGSLRSTLRMGSSRRGAMSSVVESRLSEPVQYGTSFNPFPLFTVFFTGVLMSQHQQATALSTTIHMQWGYLFCIGCLFRVITYVTMYLSPPKSYYPARPITEVLASFCLIAGGGVFISSSQQIVEAMLYRKLDAMFTMNLAVGFTALFMAWIMVCMAVKGWATMRHTGSMTA
ncbi:uncharacterized protein V1516DRAFT_618824 [Lipomyces oligophaga]|uniref:uncharacterized protein n=1 Tax=Lipomyces oligophaga TaxID=45792 RepID=UPI0034CE3E26